MTTDSFSITDYLRTRGWRHISIVLFFTMAGMFIAGIYFATLKVEYVWRWYRVPQYFYYEDTIETRAEIEGEVASLVTRGNQAEVTVRGDGEEEIYTVPAQSLQVNEGDFVYAGDVLGSYQKWKVGILVEGLWITLKVSIDAIDHYIINNHVNIVRFIHVNSKYVQFITKIFVILNIKAFIIKFYLTRSLFLELIGDHSDNLFIKFQV